MSDEDDLKAVSRDLPAIDLDPATAARIARAARRGPPLRRLLEIIAVGAIVGGTLIWTVIKVLDALR